jgi:hypothetical protein
VDGTVPICTCCSSPHLLLMGAPLIGFVLACLLALLVAQTPKTVLDVYTGSFAFYMTVNPSFGATILPAPRPMFVTTPSDLSLSFTITPGTYVVAGMMYEVNVTFKCANSEDGGSVLIDVGCFPFAPSQFMLFKQCSTWLRAVSRRRAVQLCVRVDADACQRRVSTWEWCDRDGACVCVCVSGVMCARMCACVSLV